MIRLVKDFPCDGLHYFFLVCGSLIVSEIAPADSIATGSGLDVAAAIYQALADQDINNG